MPRKKRRKKPTSKPAPDRPAGQPQSDSNDETARGWRRWVKPLLVWTSVVLATVLGTVGASTIYGAFTVIGPEVVNTPELKDEIRVKSGRDPKDIRYTVRYEDHGFELILPAWVKLTAKQNKFLEDWGLSGSDSYSLFDLARDLRAVGAATPIDEMNLVITLEGRRNQDIHVDNIRPVKIRRTSPYSGTYLDIPPQDPGFIGQMLFNFDEHSPKALIPEFRHRVAKTKRAKGLYFRKKTLTIKDGKEDAINIVVASTRHAVTFEILVEYHIGGKHRRMIINDHGRPFAVSPVNCISHEGVNPAITGDDFPFGYASYDHVWSLRRDWKSIDPVKNPRRWASYLC